MLWSMSTHRLVIPVLLASAALTLAACGGTAADSATSAPAASTSSSSAAIETPNAAPTIDEAEEAAESTEEAAAEGDQTASPACTPGASLTEQTEGPYYTPGAPERTDITDGAFGTPLTLTGYVLDANCQPVAGATVDFWQADGNGSYDNIGYVLRGMQTTDANGAYSLTTVIPGQYPGRTEHIHVKITPPGGTTYTTQLYMPDSEANNRDGIYVPGMEIAIVSYDNTEMVATFDFVLPA